MTVREILSPALSLSLAVFLFTQNDILAKFPKRTPTVQIAMLFVFGSSLFSLLSAITIRRSGKVSNNFEIRAPALMWIAMLLIWFEVAPAPIRNWMHGEKPAFAIAIGGAVLASIGYGQFLLKR